MGNSNTSQCLLFTEMYVSPSLLVYLLSNITRYILVSRYIIFNTYSVYCSLRYTFSCLVLQLLRSVLNRLWAAHNGTMTTASSSTRVTLPNLQVQGVDTKPFNLKRVTASLFG